MSGPTASVKTGFTVHLSNRPDVTVVFDEFGNLHLKQGRDHEVVISNVAVARFKKAVFSLADVL